MCIVFTGQLVKTLHERWQTLTGLPAAFLKNENLEICPGQKFSRSAFYFYSAAVSSAGAAESAAVSSSLSPHAISRLAVRIGKINFIISPFMKILKAADF